MKRLDVALVERGLAPTRNKAQQLIKAGEVEIFNGSAWTAASPPSHPVLDQPLRLKNEAETLRYVSRGGLKLAAALEFLKLEVRGARCLDLGISTGGFADCLLQNGAAQVVGYDVGHGQLAEKLRHDPRVKAYEGVNVRDIKLEPNFDLCVMDLSFISLKLILPHVAPQLASKCRILALIKPQFEVGADHLTKKGLVREEALFESVQSEILQALRDCGFKTLIYFASAVKGQDGNQEFFAFAQRG